MNKEKYESEAEESMHKGKVYICVGAIFIAFGVLMLIGASKVIDAFLVFLIVLIFLAGLFVIGFGIFFIKYAKDMMETAKQVEEKEKKRLELLKSGKWEFPDYDFFQDCYDAGVTELNSEYAKQKAENLFADIFRQNEIDLSDATFYKNKMEKYFKSGKAKWQKERDKEKTEQEEWDKKPHEGNASQSELAEIKRNNDLKGLSGISKRSFMLNKEKNKAEKEAMDQKKAAEAMEILGNAISSSAYTEKKQDWAVRGGLASGIGGLGAGISAASNAMIENQRIDARNKANVAAVSKLSGEMHVQSSRTKDIASSYSSTADRYAKEIEKINTKVVLKSPVNSELEKYLKVKSVDARKTSNKIIEINVDLENTFIPNTPEKVKMVIDGTLQATITKGNTKVGEACIALPMYGIECRGGSAKLKAYCKYYMEKEDFYDVSIKANKLWVMEY